MRRLHLSEIEDQPWCPRSLRDAMTDFLRGAFRFLGQYRVVAPLLDRALRASGCDRIVDLGSGAGGPWPDLLDQLDDLRPDESPLRVVLTDLYPNAPALDALEAEGSGRFRHHPEPVDARSVPEGLRGLRTVFTAFHHFESEDARALLRDAVLAGRPIAVFEITQRRPLAFLVLSIGVVPLCLVLAPFLRPFRWSRLFWTYLLPVAPLAAAWDGLVSCARSYLPEELLQLGQEAGGEGWTWEVRELRYWKGWSPVPVTALVGLPPRGGATVASSFQQSRRSSESET